MSQRAKKKRNEARNLTKDLEEEEVRLEAYEKHAEGAAQRSGFEELVCKVYLYRRVKGRSGARWWRQEAA